MNESQIKEKVALEKHRVSILEKLLETKENIAIVERGLSDNFKPREMYCNFNTLGNMQHDGRAMVKISKDKYKIFLSYMKILMLEECSVLEDEYNELKKI